jgi:hemerythrin superfamily protein
MWSGGGGYGWEASRPVVSEEGDEMADVFEVLKADHEEVESMLARLESGQGSDRGQLAEQLIMEESKHEAAEEMYFWPSVRERVERGDELADTAINQENEAKGVLDSLRRAEAGSSEFEELLTTFSKAGREHIAFEEEQVWPLLRQALSREEADNLGANIAKAKEMGPTRPHPHGPDGAAGLKTVGTATAMVDKARDAVTGRGKNKK